VLPDAGGNAGRDPAGRFQPGHSGNTAGRPKGAYRSGTRAAALLLDAQAEALVLKAIELALGGDPVAVRFCLGRILGARRGQPVELALPAVAALGDLAAAVTAITVALGDGRLTPDEALALSQMLDGFPRALRAAAAEPAPNEDQAASARETLMQCLDRLARAQLAEAGRGPAAEADEGAGPG
jgi:uncharacterized protein DUF5681